MRKTLLLFAMLFATTTAHSATGSHQINATDRGGSPGIEAIDKGGAEAIDKGGAKAIDKGGAKAIDKGGAKSLQDLLDYLAGLISR